MIAQHVTETQRDRFYRVVGELLVSQDNLALVLAEIGANYLDPDLPPAAAERILNVGIREQLLIGVTAGLAMAGMRPIAHTFPPFLIERPFEQVKIDLNHQQLGAVLVSASGSYGWPEGGQTHFGPRDVALLDTLDGWTVAVPGHPDEAEAQLRDAVTGDDRRYLRLDPESNREAHPEGIERIVTIREGGAPLVLAIGPTLDRVLEATEDLDVTVAYTATARPLDADGLRARVERDIVVVEPYLAGTSAHRISEILQDRAHRLLSLGVHREEYRRYGNIDDHHRLHGFDVPGIRQSVRAFLSAGS